MSQVKNTGGQKAGCIYRITLANFVYIIHCTYYTIYRTYQSVELLPNSSLNLIIGPNGTGKSTFVCAIILGLCGEPSVIGRAKNISEYVRSGCDEATIEIELYQNPGQRNVIIRRTFNTSNKSKWYIDHNLVTVKKVDNLCQLLPQDRVQDFSKMNPQELLRSTLSAVGGQESVSQLDELIECRTKQRGLSTQLQTNRQTMEEIRTLEDVDNKRLEVLRSYSEDTYKAVAWFRQNREMFQQPVYEPMMLEVVCYADYPSRKVSINIFNKVLYYRLSVLEQRAQSHRASIQEIDKKLSILESDLNELNMKRKAINEGVEKVSILCFILYRIKHEFGVTLTNLGGLKSKLPFWAWIKAFNSLVDSLSIPLKRLNTSSHSSNLPLKANQEGDSGQNSPKIKAKIIGQLITIPAVFQCRYLPIIPTKDIPKA
ncbi:hypothetical protein HF086_011950 [Spodoptera exigua]|uniref:Structural maintenance of chromosomes protein 5 n=1 Tax=Spodoptera exigua TaxID=7107 RepID=A0A922SAP8_SPOEX|nr:hypothetical protein HF086_011950 [Spodoptera exigua]